MLLKLIYCCLKLIDKNPNFVDVTYPSLATYFGYYVDAYVTFMKSKFSMSAVIANWIVIPLGRIYIAVLKISLLI